MESSSSPSSASSSMIFNSSLQLKLFIPTSHILQYQVTWMAAAPVRSWLLVKTQLKTWIISLTDRTNKNNSKKSLLYLLQVFTIFTVELFLSWLLWLVSFRSRLQPLFPGPPPTRRSLQRTLSDESIYGGQREPSSSGQRDTPTDLFSCSTMPRSPTTRHGPSRRESHKSLGRSRGIWHILSWRRSLCS